MKKQKDLNSENEITKPRKKMTKKSIIVHSILGALAIAVGVGGGIILGQNIFKVDAYKGLDASSIDFDYSDIYRKFKESNSTNYTSKFTPVELANISLLKLGDYENFYSLTEGSVVAAGVKQTIHGTTIKQGDHYFEESLSASSFVKSANRFYQDNEDIDWYKGKYINMDGGDYSNAKLTNYTFDKFEEEWGKTLARPCIYIISDKTCLSSQIDESKGVYTISLELHPTLSVLNYVKQMTMTAGLSQPPIFHSVKLYFELDKQMSLLTFKTDEVYDVHMVIDAKNSKASLTQKFFYEERNIPSTTEATNYK